MSLRVTYLDGRGPSHKLWTECPYDEFHLDAAGPYLRDEFLDTFASGERYTIRAADSTVTLAQLVTELTGVAQLSISDTDNNEGNFQLAAMVAKLEVGSGKRVWLEARVRTSSIANNVNGLAFGLAATGAAGANLQTDDTAVLKDIDHVAFRTVHAAGAILGVVYKTTGATAVVHQTTAKTLVADTWTKLGFFFDGKTSLTPWVDGAPVLTPAGDVATIDISATGFPDGVALSPFLAAKVGSAAALTVDIDWLHVYAEA